MFCWRCDRREVVDPMCPDCGADLRRNGLLTFQERVDRQVAIAFQSARTFLKGNPADRRPVPILIMAICASRDRDRYVELPGGSNPLPVVVAIAVSPPVDAIIVASDQEIVEFDGEHVCPDCLSDDEDMPNCRTCRGCGFATVRTSEAIAVTTLYRQHRRTTVALMCYRRTADTALCESILTKDMEDHPFASCWSTLSGPRVRNFARPAR